MIPGLGAGGVCFMFHGPELSPAFYLYNQGYDVWLINQRGGYYSRRHLTLDPNFDPEFWDFGIEEMTIDHTASIEYILQQTGQESLSTASLSSGGAIILAASSMNPEFYGQRVDVSILLVPTISFQYTPSPFYQFLISTPQFFDMLRFLNINELGRYVPDQALLTDYACTIFPMV